MWTSTRIISFENRRVEGMERVKGIEPSYSAWKAAALPLSYTRAGVTLAILGCRSTEKSETTYPPVVHSGLTSANLSGGAAKNALHAALRHDSYQDPTAGMYRKQARGYFAG
jgi:hypothetical protein